MSAPAPTGEIAPRERRSLSIRGQLLLLVLALGIPFLVFLLITTSRQASHDRELVGQQMLDAARLTAARLDDHIGDIRQMLFVLSTTVGMTPDDTERNDALLRGLIGRLPPQIGNVAVWMPDGRNIGALLPQARGVVLGDDRRAAFDHALSRPGLVAVAPVPSLVNGTPVGLFSVRVEREGRVVGMVSAATELKSLQFLLAPGGQGPAGSVMTVTGSDGIVLARSIDPDKWIGHSLFARGGPSSAGASSSPAAPGSTLTREGVRDGPSADGVRRIAGFTTAQRLPWQVYVGVPEREALAPVRTRLYENLAAGGVMMVVGILLSAWVAGRISAPLRQLEEDARRLGAGELTHRSAAAGASEVDSLATRLNRMAAALQERDARLQASEAEMADLYTNAPCGYHTLDAQGRFVRVNEIALRWVNRTRGQVIGRPLTDFLTDAGKALLDAKRPLLMRQGWIQDLEFDLVGDHAPRRVLASAVVVRDAGGRFLSTRTAVYDITELQKIRGDLRRLSDEQQAILDTDLIGFMKVVDRQITWANDGAAHMLGCPLTRLLDLPSRALYPDDDSYVTVGREFRDAVDAGRTFRRQLQLVRMDGEPRWFEMMAIALPTTPGASMAMLLDITPLKQAEDTRLRAAALEAQNRTLTETSRVKNLFLSNMSHELRTPLNAVLGFAYLLRANKATAEIPKFGDYLEQIESSGKHLLGMINAMLDVVQAESGRLEFQPRQVSLDAILADIVALMHGDAAARRIRMSVDVAPEVDAVVVDPGRLTQVIASYLSNAIKFSQPGGEVRLSASPDGPDRFRVTVADDGIGIAPGDIPRLFVGFQQISEGVRKTHGGVGLGLALVKRLVETQGGTVGVKSVQGAGSAFFLVLPRGLPMLESSPVPT